MRLLGLVLVLALALTACNQTDTTKNQLKDNNLNTTNVTNEGNVGKGQEYGGKGQGYGQVKKIEGQAVSPIIEAPVVESPSEPSVLDKLNAITDKDDTIVAVNKFEGRIEIVFTGYHFYSISDLIVEVESIYGVKVGGWSSSDYDYTVTLYY
jgi:hypothetical protein